MDEEFIASTLEILHNDVDAMDVPQWKKEKLKTIATYLLTTPKGREQWKHLQHLVPTRS